MPEEKSAFAKGGPHHDPGYNALSPGCGQKSGGRQQCGNPIHAPQQCRQENSAVMQGQAGQPHRAA